MGVAVFAKISVAAEFKAGTLSTVRWRDPELSVATYMAWPRERWISPVLGAFMEVARRTLTHVPDARQHKSPGSKATRQEVEATSPA
jgi:DNA-binding transcriptional LysR family regulator